VERQNVRRLPGSRLTPARIPLYELLAWIESSALGHAMRSSGVWVYGVVNLAHILGVGALFGAILMLDLRLLGVWRQIPLAALAGPAVPVAAAGLALAAASGVCLLATNATEYAGNPFLLIKFSAIAVALANVAAVRSLPGWKAREAGFLSSQEQRQLAMAGGVSLASWLVAIGAGRMIGYW
jgi:hypothetical protein